MAIIDLNSPIGLLRYRCGDFLDGAQQLPDEVYQSALDEKNGNMRAAAILCCQYILAGLAFSTQQKMGVIEVYGQQAYQQYRDYLMLIVKDPNFSGISPIPYGGDGSESPIVSFSKDWHMWEDYWTQTGGFIKVDLQ